MAYFFATADDLLPVLLGIEARRKLSYTLMDHYGEPTAPSFSSVADLPTLSARTPTDTGSTGHAYLVTEAGSPISFRRLTPYLGKSRWAVDQLENPDSTVFKHGGFYSPTILLSGEVRTAATSKLATSIQRSFDTAIRKEFSRIQAFYVGKQAELLLDSGHRLTASAQSPAEYDLRR